MTAFYVQEAVTIHQGTLENPTASVQGWRDFLGPFHSSIAAKRAYVVAFEPHLARVPDAFIARYFRPMATNLKSVRIDRRTE